MPSYSSYMRQMSVLDKDDDIVSWITVKGNHIPIRKGQSKEDAVKSFLEKKGGNAKSDNGMSKGHKRLGEINNKGQVSLTESGSGFHERVDEPKVDSEIKEAFEDFPKFKIKKDYAVVENDDKRVVVEKYSDGVIGVTTETAGGELLNSAEFKSWKSAATYANKQRILHNISVGENKTKDVSGKEYVKSLSDDYWEDFGVGKTSYVAQKRDDGLLQITSVHPHDSTEYHSAYTDGENAMIIRNRQKVGEVKFESKEQLAKELKKYDEKAKLGARILHN